MLSIVVSWCDRDEIDRSIPSLVAAAKAVGGDVTVVNFGGSSTRLSFLLANATRDVNVIGVEGQSFFNKSAAQNIGAYHSKQPYLFFCDCDIVLPTDAIKTIIEKLSVEGTFATLAGVKESQTNSREARHVTSFGYELNINTADGRHLRIVDNEEDSLNGTRQAPGLLVVRRSDFLAINGYNSRLHGWGWEDQDMISRLTLGQGLSRILHGQALHISHDDHARLARYPKVASRWESRDRMFRAALNNYDDANFSGTYDIDVKEVDHMRLA